jgi:hypothetical protein
MAKPKLVDVIMSALQPFLDELSDQWDLQPETQRRPTLPQTIDGKVNVTEIVRLLQRRNSAIKRVRRGGRSVERRSKPTMCGRPASRRL